MHDYANVRLVADRQLRYLHEAEQHRLANGRGEPPARWARGFISRIGSAASAVGTFRRRRSALALPPVAATS